MQFVIPTPDDVLLSEEEESDDGSSGFNVAEGDDGSSDDDDDDGGGKRGANDNVLEPHDSSDEDNAIMQRFNSDNEKRKADAATTYANLLAEERRCKELIPSTQKGAGDPPDDTTPKANTSCQLVACRRQS